MTIHSVTIQGAPLIPIPKHLPPGSFTATYDTNGNLIGWILHAGFRLISFNLGPTMAEKRAKDQAKAWWKRITG